MRILLVVLGRTGETHTCEPAEHRGATLEREHHPKPSSLTCVMGGRESGREGGREGERKGEREGGGRERERVYMA